MAEQCVQILELSLSSLMLNYYFLLNHCLYLKKILYQNINTGIQINKKIIEIYKYMLF